MPKVSVIVPNYNHSNYLNQRIDSIINQTYEDFELIILDDCSTDDSREVIDQYREHSKVSNIVFNKVNSGTTFKQWQKGIELAKGEYIWIAESDDWCEPNLLKTLMNGFADNSQCVIAYCQTYVITDNKITKISFHNKLAEYVNGEKYIKEYLTGSCSIWNAGMVVFKKSHYLNLSDEFTTFKLCGDWRFYIDMARQGEVFICGKVLNYFRKHDKDVSGKMYGSGNNYLEELRILKYIKNESMISEKQFKAHLLFKYIQFSVFKYKFTPAIALEVENSFYHNEGHSYKQFLRNNGKLSLFKIKAKRRLSLIVQ